MEPSSPTPAPLQHLSTGVAGLDLITGGGFFRGGIYLITGQPGAGKTILSNQMCFHHVAEGGQAVYVTVLAENHGRMLAHLRSLDFFDPEPVGESLFYLSGYYADEEDPLKKLREVVQQVIRQRRPSLLVLDGLATVGSLAASDVVMKEFVHRLHVYGEASGCTTFLLSNSPADIVGGAVHTMVDGVLDMADKHIGSRTVRELEVRKLRGTNYLRGWHSYEITSAGVVVHPRTEAVLSTHLPAEDEQRNRMGFGLPVLDKMLHGGLLSASATMLVGTPGSGKTVLGLHFLNAGARADEAGLYFGFNESAHRLINKAENLGMPFRQHVADGQLTVLWRPPLEGVLDSLAEQLLRRVRQQKVKRLVIDSYSGFREAADRPERLTSFFIALMGELRTLGVTTLLAVELPDLLNPTVRLPIEGVAALVDNIILLRYVELRSHLHRLISITKVRESGYDSSIREFTIGTQGVAIAGTFASAEAVLTGIGHPLSSEQLSTSSPAAP